MEPITEFETALRVNANSIRLPRSFYQRWGHELQRAVYVVEQNLGYKFTCIMLTTNGEAHLKTNTAQIRNLYGITQGAVIKMRYMGQARFLCTIPLQGGTLAAPTNEADMGGRDDGTSTESLFKGNSDTVSVVEIDGTSIEMLFGSDSESGSVTQYNGNSPESDTERAVEAESADDAPSLLWTTKMTPDLVNGCQTLLIPYGIAMKVFSHRPTHVQVMMPDRVLENWSLVWGDNPQLPFHCTFGFGWFQFIDKYLVIVDSEVSFLKKNNEDILRIQIKYFMD